MRLFGTGTLRRGVGRALVGVLAAIGTSGVATAQQPNPFQPARPLGRPGTPPPGAPQAPVPELPPPPAPEAARPPAAPTVERWYPVSRFVLSYFKPHPHLPSLQEIADTTTVELGRTTQGYVAWSDDLAGKGFEKVVVNLGAASARGVESYSGSALDAVLRAIIARFNALNLVAVVAAVSEDDVVQRDDPNDPEHGRDLRRPGDTELRIVVLVGEVAAVRTLAFGERIPYDERIDHPLHARIRKQSPVRPASPGDPDPQDLPRKDLIDDYVFRLNRHPGRHVDVALGVGEDVGTVALDYMVAENRPWMVYGQVSNTGTRQTNEWRERFGFINNQLTGNDDILTVDYITAGFQDSHAVIGSYEAPLVGDRLRWKVFGSWDEFTASDVGLGGLNFSGNGWYAGGELVANIAQHRELFVDAVAGARFLHQFVDQPLGEDGKDDFFLPYVGLRADRVTEFSSTRGEVTFEFSVPGIAGTGDNLDALGRIDADNDWIVMRWNLGTSFFIEPLIDPVVWRRNIGTELSTLAHEVALEFKGQYSFDYRLIPTAEAVVGGLYTVRGYPESVTAGDGALIGTLEYRFHLPRVLGIERDPSRTPLFGEPFRFRPQTAFGQTDWDLIFRGFVDVGRTLIVDSASVPESEETLIGTGVGVEFLFRRNVSLRLDWGVALEDLSSADVSSGSNRLHFVATILF